MADSPFEIYAMGKKQGVFDPWGSPVTSWNYNPPQPLVFVTDFSDQFLSAMLSNEMLDILALVFWSQDLTTCLGGLSFQQASVKNCAQYTDPQSPNQSLQKITVASRCAFSLTGSAATAIANRVAGAHTGTVGSTASHPHLLNLRNLNLH